MTNIIGLIVLAVGAVLLTFGYQAYNAPGDQLLTAVTGSHTDNTIIYFVAGAAAVVGGASLALFGRRTAS